MLTLIFFASELGQQYFCFGSMKMFVSSRTKAWLRYFFRYFRRRSYRLSVTCHNSLRRWSSGIILTFYSIYTQISFHMITTLNYNIHIIYKITNNFNAIFIVIGNICKYPLLSASQNISKYPFLSS